MSAAYRSLLDEARSSRDRKEGTVSVDLAVTHGFCGVRSGLAEHCLPFVGPKLR